ncbi:sterile alpha motif domain-containing protein 1-like [Nycticebus coucang]|uniref:sterile alpha motif domain-containing protein 1-like n=1 Tax=Nycticebus coucang TaxID=9470 RepID=UPI00234CABFB|nr:sterile alpha motif domain-containing protein 1-like [Nycticebus coucang]
MAQAPPPQVRTPPPARPGAGGGWGKDAALGAGPYATVPPRALPAPPRRDAPGIGAAEAAGPRAHPPAPAPALPGVPAPPSRAPPPPWPRPPPSPAPGIRARCLERVGLRRGGPRAGGRRGAAGRLLSRGSLTLSPSVECRGVTQLTATSNSWA